MPGPSSDRGAARFRHQGIGPESAQADFVSL